MADQQFLNAIYKLAEEIKKAPLTPQEKGAFVEAFNNEKGSAFDRAQKAINKIIGPQLQLEKSASLDNTNRIINDLKKEADKWQQSKNKK